MPTSKYLSQNFLSGLRIFQDFLRVLSKMFATVNLIKYSSRRAPTGLPMEISSGRLGESTAQEGFSSLSIMMLCAILGCQPQINPSVLTTTGLLINSEGSSCTLVRSL